MFFKKCIKIIFSLLHSFHIKGKINMGYCNSDIKGVVIDLNLEVLLSWSLMLFSC